MIKLHHGGILENIPQERGEGKEILWDPRFSHLGEGVVNTATQRASLWMLFPEKDSPGPAVISGSPQVEFDPQTSLPPASAQL